MPDRSGKYANKEKSGSNDPRNYDPQNSNEGGGDSPNIVGRYSPASQKGGGPGSAPGSNRGSSS